MPDHRRVTILLDKDDWRLLGECAATEKLPKADVLRRALRQFAGDAPRRRLKRRVRDRIESDRRASA